MANIGVYILRGTRYYVGSTSDLDRRLAQHRAGHTHTTRRIGAWELAKFFPCISLSEARALERRIKKSKNIARWVQVPPDPPSTKSEPISVQTGAAAEEPSCWGYRHATGTMPDIAVKPQKSPIENDRNELCLRQRRAFLNYAETLRPS